MREYCVKLARAPVTRDTLRGLLREQGFLVNVDGAETPTAGCMLLFGKDPQVHFPHAVISATISGKKRTVFTGNLLRQHFESSGVVPRRRNQSSAQSETPSQARRRTCVSAKGACQVVGEHAGAPRLRAFGDLLNRRGASTFPYIQEIQVLY